VENVEKKPPRGILIVSIVTVISGALLIIMGIYAFNLLLPLGFNYLMGPSFLIILGVTSLLAAYGFYRGKRWSWRLLLILSGFGAAGYLMNVANGQFVSILGVIYNAIIIWYLYRPRIRRYYGTTWKNLKKR
jgi:uncharacterized membrane protein YfcA